MGWKIDIGTAATHKYAVSASGDVVEIVERPDGGFGLVLADGQGSGPAARTIARMVAAHAAGQLRSGVRAETATIAANDLLFHARAGQVSAGLDLMTIVPGVGIELARFSTNLAALRDTDDWHLVTSQGEPAGRSVDARPIVETIPLRAGLMALLVSDGVVGAGERFGTAFDPVEAMRKLGVKPTSQARAERLLELAMEADCGRPRDDMTVVVVSIEDATSDQRFRRSSTSGVWR